MSHRTFRSLDEQPRLIGFTFWQWLRLLGLSGMSVGLVLLLGLPVKAAISVCAFAIGVPAALTYVSETGGVHWGRLILDAWRWRTRRQRLPANGVFPRARGRLCQRAPRLLRVAGLGAREQQ